MFEKFHFSFFIFGGIKIYENINVDILGSQAIWEYYFWWLASSFGAMDLWDSVKQQYIEGQHL